MIQIILSVIGIIIVLAGAVFGVFSTLLVWLINLLRAQIAGMKKESEEEDEKRQDVDKELFIEKEKMGNRITRLEAIEEVRQSLK